MARSKQSRKTNLIAILLLLAGIGFGKSYENWMSTSVSFARDHYGDMTESYQIVSEELPPEVVAELEAKEPPKGTEDYIRYVFGDHADEALKVAYCESKFRAKAVGGLGERGVFQLHPIHRARIAKLGLEWDDMFNAHRNTDVAKILFDEQGWGIWSCHIAL